MEVIEKDGKKFQVIIQKVCKTCGRIELRCRCGSKRDIHDVRLEKLIVPELIVDSSKEESIAVKEVCKSCNRILEKCNCEKVARNEQVKEILNMDEEDINKSLNEESSKKKQEMELILKQRNEAAINNVKEIVDLRKSLMDSGKSKNEVKEEVRKLKEKQKKKSEIKIEETSQEIEKKEA